MKRLFLLLVFIVTASSFFAQGYVKPEFVQQEFMLLWRDLENKQIATGLQHGEYEGTPYLFESNEASVILNSGQEINDLTIRYNVYDDQMEIKKGSHYYVIPKEKVFEGFTLFEHDFLLKPFNYGNNKGTGYFEPVVIDGNCSLYLKHDIYLKKAEQSKGYKEAQAAKFVSNPPKIYVSLNNSTLDLVNNKKDFMNLIADHQKELESFIKKNKIKFRKPESVRQLVEYYNAL